MRSHEAHVSTDSDYYIYTASTVAKKLFFYPVCVGYFHYEPGYLLKRSNYSSFLIMLITKGTCIVTLDDTPTPVSEGQVMLLDCYAPHQYETQTGCEASWLHFDGCLCRDYYEQIVQTSGNILAPRSVQTVNHALAKICNTFRNGTLIHEASLSKYITNILTELLLSGTTLDSMTRSQISLSDTVSYINEHFSENISLEQLAARASLSPFYFTRIFTRETGLTPHQYVIATRVNSAKFLLKTTRLSVKEIGFNCGFASESSFCTTFRKWEHITPSEYRLLEHA